MSFLTVDDNLLCSLSEKSSRPFELSSFTLDECRLITSKGLNSLIDSRVLGFVSCLNLSKTAVDNSTLNALSQSSNQQLSTLNLSKCTVMNDEGLEKFSRSTIFSKIQTLDLSGTRVGDKFIKSLAKPGSYHNLRQLNLNDCKSITEATLCLFLSSKAVKYIERLHLTATLVSRNCSKAYYNNVHTQSNLSCLLIDRKGTKFYTSQVFREYNQFVEMTESSVNSYHDRESAENLCKSGYLMKMTGFTLSPSSGDLIKGAETVLQSRHLINLHSLRFDSILVDHILDSLANNPLSSNVKELSLHGCKFEQKKLLEFLASRFGDKVQKLDLGWTETTNGFLQSLVDNEQICRNLEKFILSRCVKINDKGLIKFIRSFRMESIQTLDLRSTLITNLTIQAISASKYVKNLKSLIVRGCGNLRDVGFRDIFSSRVCKNLQKLDVSWSALNGDIFQFMVQPRNICQLKEIRIAGIKNCQKSLCNYLNSQFSSNLTTLDISFIGLSQYFFENTYKSPFLKMLINVIVKGIDPQVLKKGWMTLARSTHFRQVTISYSKNDNNFDSLVSIILK